LNIWLISSVVLLLLLLPATIASIRGGVLDCLIGVQLGGIITTLVFITIGIWTAESAYVDVAIVIAILSFCGGLVYAQFLERWL
jgi:multisubunit Na+/H+ antiporter MnhF subunit